MLPGFLTTALEIIIILDVCGAIAYFTITGLMRIKDKKGNTASVLPNTPPGMPALATDGLVMPTPLPARITSTVYNPVAPVTAPQEPPQNNGPQG